MSISYRHIQQYEKGMVELKEKEMTVKEIGAKFGLTYEQTHDFFKRRNRKQRKLEAGIAILKQVWIITYGMQHFIKGCIIFSQSLQLSSRLLLPLFPDLNSVQIMIGLFQQ